jgi:hypothetical protein
LSSNKGSGLFPRYEAGYARFSDNYRRIVHYTEQ